MSNLALPSNAVYEEKPNATDLTTAEALANDLKENYNDLVKKFNQVLIVLRNQS